MDNVGGDENMNDFSSIEDEGNPYDTNFDAGVEADEDEDPKHFIEQLSGKLSQSLRSYQDSLPKPDADTAKYAAGMVVKAAIDGLSSDDVKDILSKLQDDEDGDNDNEIDDSEDDNIEKSEFDGLESKQHKQMIEEFFNDIMNDNDAMDSTVDKCHSPISYRTQLYRR